MLVFHPQACQASTASGLTDGRSIHYENEWLKRHDTSLEM